MALVVTHTKVDSIPDDPIQAAQGRVLPSHWNANHTIAGNLADFVANPTASVGLAAVNGTASTAMRSDGAPALDQTAAFAFTGLGTTKVNALLTAQDLTLGSATTIGIELYGSYANATTRTVTNRIARYIGGASNTAGSFIAGAGAIIGWTSVQANSGSDAANVPDTFIGRGGVATLRLGDIPAASPVAQTLQAQGSRAGTDSNIGGANFTVTAGNGTGIGTISSLVLQSPVVVASGTGAQTQTTGLTIKGGQAVLPTYTVGTLPTGIKGGMAQVTDGDNALAWGATVINSGAGATYYQVNFNGTNWTVVGK